VIEQDGKRVELSGRHPGPTTNNRMEMQAAIEALKHLPKGTVVEILTDSEYLRKGAMTWVHLWKKRGWVTKSGEKVKNADLWVELDRLRSEREVTWTWVRGHSWRNNENNRCDALANNQRTKNIEHVLLNFDAEP